MLYTAAPSEIHGSVPGYKHLTDGATVTIQLGEELVASTVLEKSPSLLVTCRSWADVNSVLKPNFLVTCDTAQSAGNVNNCYHLACFKHPKRNEKFLTVFTVYHFSVPCI